MSAVPEVDNLSQSNLTDSIAEALQPNLRASYYRELIHCRSLPENDEMLRVIRILQILTYLIQQAPAAVATEREKTGALFGSLTEALQRVTQSIGEHQNRVDQRLAELPEDLAKRIQPAVIAKEMSESLHQEFARSGLLDLGQAFQTSFNRLEKLFARLDSLISGFESVVMKIEHEIRNTAREHLEGKVANVDRDQLGDTVNIHARGKPCVMHANAFDLMFHKKTPPLVMDSLAVWKKFEISFNFLSSDIRFSNTQSEPVLVFRTSGNIPELR